MSDYVFLNNVEYKLITIRISIGDFCYKLRVTGLTGNLKQVTISRQFYKQHSKLNNMLINVKCKAPG